MRDAGLGEGAIAWRVQRGRLHRVHRGVYLVGHWAEAPLARLAAALLAAGPDALLSWHAGLALYELRPIPLADIDVTVPPGHRGRRAGLRIHRCRLPSDQIRTRQGLRCTSPARSIVDVAPHLPTTELDPLVATSLRRRLTTKAELIEAARGRRGARRLRELLQGDGPKFTRSRAEERLLTLVRAAGLPTPLVNERVAGHEVDVLWPRHRLVAEVDGFAYHSDREAFDTDRRRDLDLHAAGLEVVRLTWRQLTDEPELLVARLAAAIERRTALAV